MNVTSSSSERIVTALTKKCWKMFDCCAVYAVEGGHRNRSSEV